MSVAAASVTALATGEQMNVDDVPEAFQVKLTEEHFRIANAAVRPAQYARIHLVPEHP
jgi:hypothetical protein